LVNRETGEACAVKEMNIEDKERYKIAQKEVCVHKLLKHPNIVQCYGSRIDSNHQFIFLEYCNGGELFDRIEPESGMPEHQAQYYFRQLISAMNYLHHRGVAHRDIKPENLLLSENDVLKLSDFGMATVFRHQGKERLLERRCGTTAYCAPEMLMKPRYNAEPSDIWSCGIVLVAMVTGELPWNQATVDMSDYAKWKDGDIEKSPHWQRVKDNLLLSLIKKTLAHYPTKRYTIEQIKNHLWFKKKFKDTDGLLIEPEIANSPKRKLARGAGHQNITDDSSIGMKPSTPTDGLLSADMADRLCASQPALGTNMNISRTPSTGHSSGNAGFSGFTQPAHLSDLLGSSQSTQAATQTSRFQRLVKRMTRFWVKVSFEETDKFLHGLLEKIQLGFKCKPKGIFRIETQDRRGAILVFRCTLIQVNQRILVDFRLSRGCGLEFKKYFAKIKQNCGNIIDKTPINFGALLPPDSIPGDV